MTDLYRCPCGTVYAEGSGHSEACPMSLYPWGERLATPLDVQSYEMHMAACYYCGAPSSSATQWVEIPVCSADVCRALAALHKVSACILALKGLQTVRPEHLGLSGDSRLFRGISEEARHLCIRVDDIRSAVREGITTGDRSVAPLFLRAPQQLLSAGQKLLGEGERPPV